MNFKNRSKSFFSTYLLLIIIYLAFISLGLPDSILGISWPYIRQEFGKSLDMVGFLTIAGTICTTISSILSGHVIARFGTGRVTAVSCLMTATGLLGYAVSPSFYFLFPCIPLLGFGAGAIDCGLNFFVAENYSARHMNWLHCCWGIGATIGPMIMTAMITSPGGWRSGYRIIGGIQMSLAVILFMSLGLWKQNALTRGENASTLRTEKHDSEKYTPAVINKTERRPVRIQIAIYVVYTSCEFLVGLWAFSLLTTKRGVDPKAAGLWISMYYGMLTFSRFCIGFIVDKTGNRLMIKMGLYVAMVGIICLALQFFFPGITRYTAMIGLIMIGAGFGPLYPCMTHETPKRFTKGTARLVIGYQTGAASLGGAVFPALVGYIGARTSLEILPFLLGLLITITLILTIKLDRCT